MGSTQQKIKRELIYNKFNGLCAYTGKPLEKDWQVDHIFPKGNFKYKNIGGFEDVNNIDNLLPTLKIVNHYKRCLDLEEFRKYMLSFHLRLAKLPKNTNVKATIRRKVYMYKIAEVFNITIDKPFIGKFYFENE